MEDGQDKRVRAMYREESLHQSGKIDDAKLMQAIRFGVNRGKTASRKRTYTYAGGTAAGLALAAGVFLSVEQGALGHRESAIVPAAVAGQQPDENGKWGEYEVFKPITKNDPILRSALEKGAVEPLNIEVEKDGYTLELYGAVRDSRKLILLYRISGQGVQSAAISLGTLTNVSGAVIGSQEARSDFYQDGSVYGYAQFELNGSAGQELESFRLQAPVYGRTLNPGYDENSEKLAVLETEVRIGSNAAEALEQHLAAGQTLTVDGQILHVEEALVTPQRGYFVLVPDASNDKNISRLIGAKLTVSKDGETVVSKGGAGVDVTEVLKDGSSRFIFTFNRTPLPQNPDSVVFSVEGIEAMGQEERKLVVNTKTNEVLQAPNRQFYANVNAGADNTEVILFGYPINFDKISNTFDPSSTLSLARTFTDAAGREYPLQDFTVNGAVPINKIWPGSKSTTVSYQYEQKDYVQPLTFTIASYANEILEHKEVKLK
ncbi:DUF4179 domain-containing protein [Saccharibacillus qingshengii]|uniref:DUF4179 domain-containing protein n=1 Tax=Saccharibacillus qingshengii TaxID=1763540 RepID=UPI0015550A14|nr:DUF4179 domain-containing protein [Saccharibacillus qingshengii]